MTRFRGGFSGFSGGSPSEALPIAGAVTLIVAISTNTIEISKHGIKSEMRFIIGVRFNSISSSS
jgi:hypothetical protein